MNQKLIIPIMLLVFLASSAISIGQENNEKKIDRIQRKIERQSKKLQELTAEEYRAFEEMPAPMDSEEIATIQEEAMEQAEEAREQVREAMEEQHEAMLEHHEALKDQKREMKEMQLEILNDLKGKKFHYYYSTPNFKFKCTDSTGLSIPDFEIGIPECPGREYSIFSDDTDNLSINKTLTDESGTADFSYAVNKEANGMSVMVNGAIDSGKVKIIIKRPDGEQFNEYTLSSLANVNWKQNISFEDLQESEYLGQWTVTVTAEKANGQYSVRLNGR